MKGSVRRPRTLGGSWAYRIDVPAGKGQTRRQVQMAGFVSVADARVALEAALAEYEFERPLRRAPDSVGGFLTDRWPRGIRGEVAASALSNYVTIVSSYVVPRIGEVRLSKLRSARIDQLYVDLLAAGAKGGGPLAPATVAQVHRTLRRALNDAVRWGLIDRNPAVDVKLPRSDGPQLRVWTPMEVATFLASVRDDRLGVLWLFALHTGLRRGELAGLRWRDLDLVSGKVSIVVQRTTDGYRVVLVEPKAGSRRVVQLAADVLVQVRAHGERQAAERAALGLREAGPDDTVFADERGEPFHPQRLRVLFGRASNRAGLPSIRLHDLRHTMATTALSAGIHPKVVQERLGHTTVAMTLDTYSHVTDTIQSEGAERLHRAMNPKSNRRRNKPDPPIGESLEESPEAVIAAATPMPERRPARRGVSSPSDHAFSHAISQA